MNVRPLAFSEVSVHLPSCLANVALAYAAAAERTPFAMGCAGEAEHATELEDFVRGASTGGHLAMLKRHAPNWETVLSAACFASQLHVVQYAVTRVEREPWFKRVAHRVFRGGAPCDVLDRCLANACVSGDLHIAKLIIAHGATNFTHALESACGHGHLALARLMLDKGARNMDQGLIAACWSGDLQMAAFMIDRGAQNFNWALSVACAVGHFDLAKLLIARGATDFNQPLYWACVQKHGHVARLLVAHGATTCRSCGRTAH
jgi:hypothetical protein